MTWWAPCWRGKLEPGLPAPDFHARAASPQEIPRLIRESVDLTLFQEAPGSARALVPGVWDTCCSQPGFAGRGPAWPGSFPDGGGHMTRFRTIRILTVAGMALAGVAAAAFTLSSPQAVRAARHSAYRALRAQLRPPGEKNILKGPHILPPSKALYR